MNIEIRNIRQRRHFIMDLEKKKQKGILDYIFQFAGEYKGAYIKSVVFDVVGVAFVFLCSLRFDGR